MDKRLLDKRLLDKRLIDDVLFHDIVRYFGDEVEKMMTRDRQARIEREQALLGLLQVVRWQSFRDEEYCGGCDSVRVGWENHSGDCPLLPWLDVLNSASG